MPILEPGRVCMKIAGREAGKQCAVLEVVDSNYVLVEGPEVRRRKTNIAHIEPLAEMIDIKKDVKQQLVERYNIKLPEKKKERAGKKTEKPAKIRGAAKMEKEGKKQENK